MKRSQHYAYPNEDSASLNLATLHLSPSQHAVARQLLTDLGHGGVCLLRGGQGTGKTTVLRWLISRVKGSLVSVRRCLRGVEAIERALCDRGPVFVDDVHVLSSTDDLSRLIEHAGVCQTTVLFTSVAQTVFDSRIVPHLRELTTLKVQDFEWLCSEYLGESTSRIDFRKVLRHFPALNGHQLKSACLWLGLREEEPDTNALLEYLKERQLQL